MVKPLRIAGTSGVCLALVTSVMIAQPVQATNAVKAAPRGDVVAAQKHGITAAFTAIYDDSSYQANTKATPYKDLDVLYLAFVHINHQTKKLDFKVDSPGGKAAARDRMINILNLTKKLRKQGKLKVVASLGHGAQNDDIPLIEKNLKTFAPSVKRFVKKWGLNGFDIDYEIPQFSTHKAFKRVSKSIRSSLGQQELFTITPNTPDKLDGYTLNKYYDYVNVQNYDAENDAECPITDFTNMPGLPSSKILAGLDIEGGDKVKRAGHDYRKYNLAGIFAWKLAPDFKPIATEMKHAVR